MIFGNPSFVLPDRAEMGASRRTAKTGLARLSAAAVEPLPIGHPEKTLRAELPAQELHIND